MIGMVVLKSPVQVENHLLLEALELTQKILSIYSFRQEYDADGENVFFRAFTRKLINDFMNNLAMHNPIFQETKIISIL
jgi:hypothetical protein